MIDTPIIVIYGQTASGKSNFAQLAAELLGGEIINADMAQFYAPCSIGTAMPEKASMRAVPHWLYGSLRELVDYNVSQFRVDCQSYINEIKERKKILNEINKRLQNPTITNAELINLLQIKSKLEGGKNVNKISIQGYGSKRRLRNVRNANKNNELDS